MKKIFAFLLATSLTANAWLLLRAPSSRQESAATAPAPKTPARATDAAPSFPAATIHPLAALDTGDLAALRDELRAAGVEESSIRWIIDGALRNRYRVQITAWRIDRWRTAWWRGGLNAPGGPKMPSLRELAHDPMRQLLGTDALDVADAEVRYDFLSPEKRRLLAAIDLDYAELRSRAPGGRNEQAATKSELDELQLLNSERRKDVLATLTDEERAEYDLRFSFTAVLNSRRFAAIEVTEPEFRAIEPLIAVMREQTAVLPRDMRVNDAPGRVEIEQRTIDQVVAAVGYDRALDYLWGMDSGPYATTVRVLRDVNLPASNASRLLQLAAETGAEATVIHYDGALTPDQKRAALLALQQTVRPRLDALVPPEAQPKLEEHAIAWFAMLADGRYVRRPPMLFGSGFMMSSPTSVTVPAVGPRPVVPLARPPGK